VIKIAIKDVINVKKRQYGKSNYRTSDSVIKKGLNKWKKKSKKLKII
jgi:hypothetical protein